MGLLQDFGKEVKHWGNMGFLQISRNQIRLRGQQQEHAGALEELNLNYVNEGEETALYRL